MNLEFSKPDFQKQLIEWRRSLHMHPEISGEEKETAEFIVENLKKIGVEVEDHIAGYGVVGIIRGDSSKKCVALRADMDALPIDEKNDCIYKSQYPGKMHACGHDTHMAMVLGAMAYLAKNPPGGTVKCIFQPREEKPPGGAKFMVEAGVLDNPKVDAVIGTHITTSYPVGTIAIREGATMAVADDFKLTIYGKGGHAASPQNTIDAIAVAAQAIDAIQTIASRRVDPTEPIVLTIGTIKGGTAQNIISDKVEMTGTLRCMSNKMRDKVLNFCHATLRGVTEAWDTTYDIDYLYGYPPVVNDDRLLHVVEKVIESLPGASIHHMDRPLMAGEDFSYYGTKAPSIFFFTGAGNENKNQAWHNCRFDVDEKALAFGCGALALTAAYIAGEDK